MPRWYLKSLIGRTLGRSALGTGLYRLATNYLLRTQRRAPWKWCMWFREHLLLARRYAGVDFEKANVWLMDSGWTVAPQVLAYLATGGHVLATERHQPVLGTYNAISVQTVLENLWTLGKSYTPTDKQRATLDRVRSARTAAGALKALGSFYYHPFRGPHSEDLLSSFSGSVDLAMSMGVLEHYALPDLEAAIARMARMTRNGGCVSHIIDHRDHFYHADQSISPWHHLEYSPRDWQRLAGNRLFYINRLLQSDYVDLFERAGFEILYLGSKPYPQEARPYDRSSFYGGYADASESDLGATVTHLLAVKRPLRTSNPMRRLGEPATSRLPREAIAKRYRNA